MNLHLVYQSGIANVFKGPEGARVRLLQSDYRSCENFCHGAIAAGSTVEIHHCDLAGDIVGADWSDGAGEIWREDKFPPC